MNSDKRIEILEAHVRELTELVRTLREEKQPAPMPVSHEDSGPGKRVSPPKEKVRRVFKRDVRKDLGKVLGGEVGETLESRIGGIWLSRVAVVLFMTAFALGATWAGMGGVVFAAKTTFINPASFTIWESIIILCVVVLGGMGSIVGVVMGALVLILLPEYLRAFSEYRMLIFGAILVVMMVFRPGGLISNVRRTYQFEKK